MKFIHKIVNQIPISRLWDENGFLDANRKEYLSESKLKSILRHGAVAFYIANVGYPLQKINAQNCFEFWKSEVKQNLVKNPDRKIDPGEYDKGYCYLASQWSGGIKLPIIVLEKYH